MLPAAASRRLGLCMMPIIRHEKRSCPCRPAAFLSAVSSSSSSSVRASSPASAAALLFSTNTATYYDSQSGLHIPIHDETQIQVYLNAPLVCPEQQQQQQQQFKIILQTAIDRGMAGALIRNNDPDMLFQSLASLLSPAERDFTLCVPAAPTTTVSDMAVPNIHVSTMFEYRDDDDGKDEEEEDVEATTTNVASLEESLSQHMSRMGTTGIHTNTRAATTSIGLFQNELYEKDPILVASNVASVLDAVGAGGGDLLWLLRRPAPNNHEHNGSMGDDDDDYNDDEEDDALVALCQELAYLDVTGPTMKSRLVVDASSPDQVEECLFMGINKFVLSSRRSRSSSSSTIQTDDPDDDMAAIYSRQAQEAQLDWLQTVVQDQGKKLMISPS
eukprot:scaffold51837_cov56-Attheya_sp.AAC.3